MPPGYTLTYAEPGTWCLGGWRSPKPHTYTGGCSCDRPPGHPGRCRCECGSTCTRPPPAWDLP